MVSGERRNGIARLNVGGTLDTSFNAAGSGLYAGNISDIVVQPDSKILIGGNFNSYNGVLRYNIARLNADGSVDTTFNPVTPNTLGSNSAVNNVTLQQDGKIIISGFFTQYNETTRNQIARLNTNGSLDTTFDSGTGVNGYITETAIQHDGKILIVGQFTQYNGVSRGKVARLNSDGTLDNNFNPGTGADTCIKNVALQQDGKIIVGGCFSNFNGVSRRRVARLNTDGSLDNSFSIPNVPSFFNGIVDSILIQPDGQILIGGSFSFDLSSTKFAVLRLNTDGSLDSAFTSSTTNSTWGAWDLARQPDGKIVVGGVFTQINENDRINFARLNANGSLDSSFADTRCAWYGSVNAITQQPDGKIVVGGDFRFANGVLRRNIARFNIDGTLDVTFNSAGYGADSYINAIAVQPNGKMIISGFFSNYNGVSRNTLARINADGSLDTTFTPPPIGSGSGIYDIVVLPNNKILLAGAASVNNTYTTIFRLNFDGSLDTSFPLGAASRNILTLAVQPDGKILIGGLFTSFGNVPVSGIARLNSDGSLDSSFNIGTGVDAALYDIALQPDGKVVIVGSFSTFNGVNRRGIARIDPDGSLDTSFNPGTGVNGFYGTIVYSVLLQQDGKILIGGEFERYNEILRNDLAQLNSDGSLDTSFVPAFPSVPYHSVNTLAIQTDGKVLVGGTFPTYSGTPRYNLLRFQASVIARRTLFDFDGDGKADQTVFRPTDRVWYLLRSSSGFTAAQFGSSTDRIAPADFDGDGKTDIAVFRDGFWYWLNSSNGSFNAVQFGQPGDVPVPADYSGDGRVEVAVYRGGFWYTLNLANNQFQGVQFGISTDKPVPADFDADGKTDYAVYRDGTWYLLRSLQGFTAVQFGNATDKPIVGDYDGDGRADQAVYRAGTWYVLGSTQGFYGVQFGAASDVPVAADYDGDGKTDIAVFRDGVWYMLRSQQGFGAVQLGATNDRPIPAAHMP